MANNYVYTLNGTAYINLTNRCHNACDFCIRKTGDGVRNTKLWLDSEPTALQVMAAFSAIAPTLTSKEAVFCGFGEPTECLDTLKEVASALKSAGFTTRLNTNGLGSAANGRDIVPELSDIDIISVSLNQFDAQSYLAVTHSAFGESAFGYVTEFARACKAQGKSTVFTVVDTIGETAIKKCIALAEKLRIPLRVRKFIADNYDSDED